MRPDTTVSLSKKQHAGTALTHAHTWLRERPVREDEAVGQRAQLNKLLLCRPQVLRKRSRLTPSATALRDGLARLRRRAPRSPRSPPELLELGVGGEPFREVARTAVRRRAIELFRLVLGAFAQREDAAV